MSLFSVTTALRKKTLTALDKRVKTQLLNDWKRMRKNPEIVRTVWEGLTAAFPGLKINVALEYLGTPDEPQGIGDQEFNVVAVWYHRSEAEAHAIFQEDLRETVEDVVFGFVTDSEMISIALYQFPTQNDLELLEKLLAQAREERVTTHVAEMTLRFEALRDRDDMNVDKAFGIVASKINEIRPLDEMSDVLHRFSRNLIADSQKSAKTP